MYSMYLMTVCLCMCVVAAHDNQVVTVMCQQMTWKLHLILQMDIAVHSVPNVDVYSTTTK